MSKKIIYAGLEQCDVVYHLATILSLSSNKVVVVDDSIRKDLFMSMTKEEDTNIYEWRNIIFVKNVDLWKSEEMKDADYIIEYAGMNPHHEFMDRIIDKEESSEDKKALWLMMPDYTYFGVNVAVKVAMGRKDNDDMLYIPRNFCTKKVTDKSLAILMGVEPSEIAGHIPFDATDMASYVALTHNGHQNIKGISDTMLQAITYIVSQILHVDEKRAKKAVAKAKKIRR